MDEEYRVLGWKILGGKTYELSDAPSWWSNEIPLLYSTLHIMHSQLPFVEPGKHEQYIKANIIDAHQLPLREFPLIEDFEVILWTTLSNHSPNESQLLYQVYFFSQSRGLLARLRHWDYTLQELCRANFTIPHGDFTTPYFDFDQGWALLIAEHDEFVYILTGSFEDLLAEKGYRTWFKVEKSRYFRQWEQAVQLARQWCAQQQKN